MPFTAAATHRLCSLAPTVTLAGWQLRLHHAGTDPDKREVLARHSHPFLEVVVIERGRGRDERPTGDSVLSAPMLVLAAPDEVHRLHVDLRQRMVMTWFGLAVDGEPDPHSLAAHWLRGHRPVAPLDAALAGHLQALQRECDQAGPAWTLAASDHLRLLIIGALRATVVDQPRSEAADAESALIDAFLALIRSEPALGPREVAQRLRLHERRLARLVHRRLGCSPLVAITRERMTLARLWLNRPELSVAAIALRLGYADPRHFARTFRAATGVPPAVWRQDDYRRDGPRS